MLLSSNTFDPLIRTSHGGVFTHHLAVRQPIASFQFVVLLAVPSGIVNVLSI